MHTGRPAHTEPDVTVLAVIASTTALNHAHLHTLPSNRTQQPMRTKSAAVSTMGAFSLIQTNLLTPQQADAPHTLAAGSAAAHQQHPHKHAPPMHTPELDCNMCWQATIHTTQHKSSVRHTKAPILAKCTRIGRGPQHAQSKHRFNNAAVKVRGHAKVIPDRSTTQAGQEQWCLAGASAGPPS